MFRERGAGFKMREIARIDRILDMIRDYWKRNPDQRFNQCLINLGIIPDGNHWSIGDDVIEKALKENA